MSEDFTSGSNTTTASGSTLAERRASLRKCRPPLLKSVGVSLDSPESVRMEPLVGLCEKKLHREKNGGMVGGLFSPRMSASPASRRSINIFDIQSCREDAKEILESVFIQKT